MGRTLRSRQRKKVSRSYEKIVIDSSTVELLKWMGIRTKLQLFDFPQSGRGLKSKTAIQNHQILINVPMSKMITRQSLESKYPPNWSTHVMLVHFLCEEKSHLLTPFFVEKSHLSSPPEKGTSHISATLIKNSHLPTTSIGSLSEEISHLAVTSSGSNWKIYLNSLPKTYDVPFFDIPPDLLPMIRPKSTQDLVQAQHDLVRRKFDKYGLSWNWNMFAWAWFTVNTRAVYFKDGHDNLALAPVLDMFNHSCHVQVKVEHTPDLYTLKAGNAQKPGQIFINYGPHDNVKLYLEYGFVLPDNPHDHVKLCLDDLLVKDFTNLKEKLDFIKKHGLVDKLQIIPDEEVVTWSVIACFQIFISDCYGTSTVYQNAECSLENAQIRQCVKLVVERISQEIQETLENPDVIRMTRVLPQLLRIQHDICKKSLENLLLMK